MSKSNLEFPPDFSIIGDDPATIAYHTMDLAYRLRADKADRAAETVITLASSAMSDAGVDVALQGKVFVLAETAIIVDTREKNNDQ